MSTTDQAKNKVVAAEKACDKSLDAWRTAVSALGTDVSVNGYGIIHDRSAFSQRLQSAQLHIAESLAALDGVDWPTNAEYDQL